MNKEEIESAWDIAEMVDSFIFYKYGEEDGWKKVRKKYGVKSVLLNGDDDCNYDNQPKWLYITIRIHPDDLNSFFSFLDDRGMDIVCRRMEINYCEAYTELYFIVEIDKEEKYED